jgi:hypothetical protein
VVRREGGPLAVGTVIKVQPIDLIRFARATI